jgi:hypothetical protein
MIRPPSTSRLFQLKGISCAYRHLAGLAAGAGLMALAMGSSHAQVITIDTHTGNATSPNGTVDRRYAQIQPTNVSLDKGQLDPKTRQELIRVLQSEQGFAMRPFPRGHKGLTLEANGKLKPAGEGYLDMVTQFGICAKPGDRLVLTDVKIEHDKIIFDLNGGPDLRHRILRHIEIGAGTAMTPVVQGDDQQPTGARLTLDFKGHIPELTGSQVKALLAPLISFDVKTPIQAFTDTLPPKLKDAILNHRVMVGMSTDMVLFTLGQPQRKVRETHDQMPFEEWIYGAPPEPVQFVRINGNRVIRVEIAKVGEQPEIFTKDEVEGLMRTDGTPAIAVNQGHPVHLGDVQRNPDTQAPAPPPTLTNPGEKLPGVANTGAGQMKPVEFPKQKPDDYPDATNLPRDRKPDNADQQQGNPDAEGAEQKQDQKSGQTNAQAQPTATSAQPPAQPQNPEPLDKPQPH